LCFGCHSGVHSHVSGGSCEHSCRLFLHNTAHKSTHRAVLQSLSLWGLLPIPKKLSESCCCVTCAVTLQTRACSLPPLLNTCDRPRLPSALALAETHSTDTWPKA
jgi:hypothetical protein